MLDLTGDEHTATPLAGTTAPVLANLATILAGSGSGIAFVYEALDAVAARFGLRDAMVVVPGPGGYPQAFRLQRAPAPLVATGSLPAADTAGPGFYCDPPVVDTATGEYLTGLATIALRLDVTRLDASRDPLTGLLNRRSYDEALAQAVARAQRYGWPFALVLLDLDHFKTFNDDHGHAHGDEVLRRFGTDLRSCLRSGDVAARIGGDEFALVVLAGSGRPSVEALVERVRATVASSSGRAGLRFSAGVAYFPEDAGSAADLAGVADARLYADKTS